MGLCEGRTCFQSLASFGSLPSLPSLPFPSQQKRKMKSHRVRLSSLPFRCILFLHTHTTFFFLPFFFLLHHHHPLHPFLFSIHPGRLSIFASSSILSHQKRKKKTTHPPCVTSDWSPTPRSTGISPFQPGCLPDEKRRYINSFQLSLFLLPSHLPRHLALPLPPSN